MGKALVLAAALLLLAVPTAEGASKPNGSLRTEALETVLRLHDLPPGYTVGDGSECVAYDKSELGILRAYDRWVARYRPEGCEFSYERRFRIPDSEPAPRLVKGETINTPSEEAALKGSRILLEVIARLTSWRRMGPISLGPAGPTATLFHFKKDDEPASVLVWRYGKLLAALEADGLTGRENDSAVLRYAQIQQGRLESPSPYTEAEREDTEVVLEDPDLMLPVYWLGSTFEPRNDFPPAELQTATVIEKGGLPGAKIELRYDGFNIETWTRRSWARFRGSFLGKINRPPCTRTTRFEWGPGHAVISAGYRRRTFDDGCPDYPPTRYWAFAHIGGVVIGVNQTTCRCLSPGSGPYSSSLSGMKTILRNLVLRPKPDYGP